MFIITTHAIERYQERFHLVSPQEAELALQRVCSESRPAPKSIRRKMRNKSALSHPGFEYRYHNHTSLFLVIDPENRLVTVWPVV